MIMIKDKYIWSMISTGNNYSHSSPNNTGTFYGHPMDVLGTYWGRTMDIPLAAKKDLLERSLKNVIGTYRVLPTASLRYPIGILLPKW